MQNDTQKQPIHFAIVGLGFIFDKHLAGIEHIGGKLVCACDNDSQKKEKLDSDVMFFTDFDKMATSKVFEDVDWVVICTPNHLHFKYAQDALHAGKNILIEKPTVIRTEDLKRLQSLAELLDLKALTVMQLRESERLNSLKKELSVSPSNHKVEMELKMHRGDFYWEGWKGIRDQSGGILFNIGVHYLDLMLWLFGQIINAKVIHMDDKKAQLRLTFKNGDVDWSIDLTADKDNQCRNLTIDNERINLTRMLESLHDKVYERLAEGEGTRLPEVMPVLSLCEKLTHSYGG